MQRRSQAKNIGRCRPVGLRPTSAATALRAVSMPNRVKQMYELSVGTERASTVLQELVPSNILKPAKHSANDVDDDASSLTSCTALGRHSSHLALKGSPLKLQTLPQQSRDDYVSKWLPEPAPHAPGRAGLVADYLSSPSQNGPSPSPDKRNQTIFRSDVKKVSRNLFNVQVDPTPDVCGRHEKSDRDGKACNGGIASQEFQFSFECPNQLILDSELIPSIDGSFECANQVILDPKSIPSIDGLYFNKTATAATEAFDSLEFDSIAETDTQQIFVVVPAAEDAEKLVELEKNCEENCTTQGDSADAGKMPKSPEHETSFNGSNISYAPSSAPSSDSENENLEDTFAASGNEDVNGDNTSEETPAETGKKRKKVRVRQPTSAKRKALQTARNSGQAYISSASGKLISEKSAVPLNDCRKHCSAKLSPDICSSLCQNLWQLGDHDKRAAHIGSLIEIVPKASQRLFVEESDKKKNRQYTFNYHVIVAGANVPVCKGCFLKIYCVTPKFIEIVTKKKLNSIGGTISQDVRGKKSASLPDAKVAEVREHLDSFPKYQSHYARAKCDKSFLPNTLTLKIMYEEYKIKYPSKPVSRFIYEREFHAMNLQIKPLKIDTCQKCDRLDTAIRYAQTEEEKHVLTVEQELHHRKAEKAKTQKQLDTKDANNKHIVVAFDLQQCLPTPFLQSSVVFYKRQLWTYNLTIHDCASGKSHHNMWHEGEAERGPNEIGSAVYLFLKSLPKEVEQVTLYSDTCGGQNKNSIMNVALQTALHDTNIQIINQKFLVSGHTHLDCDTDHAVIEKKKKQAVTIHVPRDWYNLVNNASSNFTVHHMSQDLQMNFKALLTGRQSPLVKRKKNVSGQPFVWKDICWIQHNKSLPLGTIAYKDTLDQDVPFSHLNMKRQKKSKIILSPDPTYDGPKKINQKKKDDLLSLLHLIDPDCRKFYKKLKGDAEIDDDDPDLPRFFETDDEEESSDEE